MNTSPRPPTLINTPSYPREFQQVILEKSQNFIGGVFVFTAISNFLQRHNRGYFTIVGAPGSGKSAILAKYVQENPHVIYYNAQLPTKNRAEEFLTSTCTQLAQTSGDKSLYSLLQQVSDQLNPQQKLIIAIDALDAIDTSHQSIGSNIFYLPRYLPQGVYFLLTRRPFLKTKSGLLIEAPSQVLDLAAYPEQNRQDFNAYIRQYVNNNEELVAQLIANSENNFMYLSQILPVISDSEALASHRGSGFDGLPPNLETYYRQHLEKMIPANLPSVERKLKLSVLKVLAEVSSSAEAIASRVDVDEYDVEEVLEDWREFLRLEEVDGEIRYGVYHWSFGDFLQEFLGK
ncbi:MAG: ATP-binding protein [Nostoc sp. S4]|nr:ATP-binding protein [Nostoc sp. S4]